MVESWYPNHSIQKHVDGNKTILFQKTDCCVNSLITCRPYTWLPDYFMKFDVDILLIQPLYQGEDSRKLLLMSGPRRNSSP